MSSKTTVGMVSMDTLIPSEVTSCSQSSHTHSTLHRDMHPIQITELTSQAMTRALSGVGLAWVFEQGPNTEHMKEDWSAKVCMCVHATGFDVSQGVWSARVCRCGFVGICGGRLGGRLTRATFDLLEES